MSPFEKYLINELGLAKTRAPQLCKAMDDLHRALAAMYGYNTGLIKSAGFENLFEQYCLLEHIRNILRESDQPMFKGGAL